MSQTLLLQNKQVFFGGGGRAGKRLIEKQNTYSSKAREVLMVLKREG